MLILDAIGNFGNGPDSQIIRRIENLGYCTGVGWGPSIGLAVRKNQSKNMPLKRIDLAKALDYTSF